MSMIGLGGLARRRPDQNYRPPEGGNSPGARSNVFARLVVIFGTGNARGLFIYNGKPGPGNPPVLSAVAPGVTTDPYGNAVTAILTVGSNAGAHVNIDQLGNLLSVAASGAMIGLKPAFPAELIYDAAGALQLSGSPVAGTDGTHPFVAGWVAYDPVGGTRVRLSTGSVLFNAAGVVTEGFVRDLGGTANWQSSKLAAGDTSASVILQSKNESNDGLHAELVMGQRVQLQDETGAPSWICQVDPNSPNADEAFHNLAFAGAGATLWSGGGRTVPGYRLQADKAEVLIGGSFTVPSGGPVAGQSMTIATPTQYRPNQNQSITGWGVSGTGVNVACRIGYSAAGVLSFGGLVANFAAGSVIDVPFQPIALSR